jgi:hypothetical protein
MIVAIIREKEPRKKSKRGLAFMACNRWNSHHFIVDG